MVLYLIGCQLDAISFLLSIKIGSLANFGARLDMMRLSWRSDEATIPIIVSPRPRAFADLTSWFLRSGC